MQQADFVALVHAAQSLETMSLATRMNQLVGMPIENAMACITRILFYYCYSHNQSRIEKSIGWCFIFPEIDSQGTSANKIHRFLAGLSGALGGSIGNTVLLPWQLSCRYLRLLRCVQLPILRIVKVKILRIPKWPVC
jgi:hypothetical protein